VGGLLRWDIKSEKIDGGGDRRGASTSFPAPPVFT